MVAISIITAVYNRRLTVGQTLDSVFSQSHEAKESIIVDGGSTDGTLDVLGRYRSQTATFISEPDDGIYDALNKGIRHAKGDVVGFLHGDDLFAHNDALAWVAQAFEEDPAVQAVYGDLVYVSHHDSHRVVRYWRAGEFDPKALRRGWMPPHPTLYVRRSVYERLGLFDTRYRIAADYDSMLRLLAGGRVRVAYVPKVLVRMRVGGASNGSLGAIVRKSTEDLRVIRRNGVGGVGTLLQKNLRKLSQFWTR
jgi:glycosyltransferase